MSARFEDGNSKIYRGGRARRQFSSNVAEGLWPAELACLALLTDEQHGAVLDLGIGGGRTTAALSKMFDSYIGVDYSPAMVAAARERFPSCRLEVMDARKLAFNEAFDCIVFSYNGIDYVDIQGRLVALAGIHKALKPGGLFFYSTHNAANPRRPIWMQTFWVSELMRLRAGARMLANRWRNFGRQSSDPDGHFFVVNDPGIGFSLLTVYVDIAREIGALEKLGFVVELAIGNTRSEAGYSDKDSWVYLAVRKPPAPQRP